MPTSYYRKVGGFPFPTPKSTTLVINFFLISGLVLVLPFLRRSEHLGYAGRVLLVGSSIGGSLFLLFAANSSAVHMMFSYRFFVPYLPLVGLALALSLKSTGQSLAPGVLAIQLVVGLIMFSGSLNVTPIKRLPGGPEYIFEFSTASPGELREINESIKNSALQLDQHWSERPEASERTPAVYLAFGGSGYWLRDFYVFEYLISYRRACSNAIAPWLYAADYVQHHEWVRADFRPYLLKRPDIDEPVEAVLSPLDISKELAVRYWVGPSPPTTYRRSSSLRSACEEIDVPTIDWQRVLTR